MRKILLMAILAAFTAVSAQAAVISAGVWSPVSAADVNNDGVEFWDHKSYDGDSCGAGHILATANPCKVLWGYDISGLEYLNDGSGNAVPFMFSGVLDDPGVSVYNVITAWAESAEFGVSTGVGFKETVFTHDSWTSGSGVAQPTSDLSGPWQTWFKSKHGLYSSAGNFDQFALFRQDLGNGKKRYWLSIEDIFNGGRAPYCFLQEDEWCNVLSDRDYNDFMVMFEQSDPESVPEPTSLALLGLSLFGARYLRRRRK